MLKSKELRAKAWESLKGKYWKAFWVSIVTGIIYSLGVSFTVSTAALRRRRRRVVRTS